MAKCNQLTPLPFKGLIIVCAVLQRDSIYRSLIKRILYDRLALLDPEHRLQVYFNKYTT